MIKHEEIQYKKICVLLFKLVSCKIFLLNFNWNLVNSNFVVQFKTESIAQRKNLVVLRTRLTDYSYFIVNFSFFQFKKYNVLPKKNLFIGYSFLFDQKAYFELWRKKVGFIRECFYSRIGCITHYGSDTVAVVLRDVKTLVSVMQTLRDVWEFKYQQLTDLTCVDLPQYKKRFSLTYTLLSLRFNQRLLVKISVSERDIVPSITSIFASANWFEREVFDMFGLQFSNHPDLRRLLTDYGFIGFPLRKDFPVMGFYESRYDNFVGRVISTAVYATQELRLFFFLSPWRKKK